MSLEQNALGRAESGRRGGQRGHRRRKDNHRPSSANLNNKDIVSSTTLLRSEVPVLFLLQYQDRSLTAQGVNNRKLLQEYFFIRRLLENYCLVLLTDRASPQISDNRPDVRHRELFVKCRAAWHWNKMLLAQENVDSSRAAMVVATLLQVARLPMVCMSDALFTTHRSTTNDNSTPTTAS